MTTEASKADFNAIAQKLVMNLSALRVFNDRIGAAAMEHDRLAVDTFIDKMKEILPKEFSDDGTDSAQSASLVSDNYIGEVPPSSESDETQSTPAEEIDPARVRQLIRAAKSLAKAAPVQSTLLRESGLISRGSFT